MVGTYGSADNNDAQRCARLEGLVEAHRDWSAFTTLAAGMSGAISLLRSRFT